MIQSSRQPATSVASSSPRVLNMPNCRHCCQEITWRRETNTKQSLAVAFDSDGSLHEETCTGEPLAGRPVERQVLVIPAPRKRKRYDFSMMS